MNPLLEITGRVLAVLGVIAVLVIAAVAVVMWRAVLPALLIGTLAVASGMVRTLALAGFAVLAGLRAAMLALDRAGAAVPAPRLRRRAPRRTWRTRPLVAGAAG
ncbi:hypothetical protein SAMN05216215_1022133 [Saccharopolyspora shandongensis]|uniref:Uncharacterized protein n=1 Tax=Saccharopolyspora shandongensis TaxID=418495 RepID=A0A1H3IEJ5_9PSEU|nr:hypothetical protein [Saccharopolyspora shandongensis]SDY25669.1 hypothetical protein SAMN05216215_1022133 [Saccharopolyspora shandongensis]